MGKVITDHKYITLKKKKTKPSRTTILDKIKSEQKNRNIEQRIKTTDLTIIIINLIIRKKYTFVRSGQTLSRHEMEPSDQPIPKLINLTTHELSQDQIYTLSDHKNRTRQKYKMIPLTFVKNYA